MATRSGFEPPISGLTGQYVSRYTTGPQEGGRTFVRTLHSSVWGYEFGVKPKAVTVTVQS